MGWPLPNNGDRAARWCWSSDNYRLIVVVRSCRSCLWEELTLGRCDCLQGSDDHGDSAEEANTGSHASSTGSRDRGRGSGINTSSAGDRSGGGQGGESTRGVRRSRSGGRRSGGRGGSSDGLRVRARDNHDGGRADAVADGGEANLGDGHLRADGDGAAGRLASTAGAGNNRRRHDLNGGVDGGGDSSGGGSEDGGDGGRVGDDAGVLAGVAGADTLEVGDGLGNLLVRLAVGVQAVENVVDERLVRAVAVGVGVVRAADGAEPGVQARRHDTGAGQSLNGGSRRGGRDTLGGRNALSRGNTLSGSSGGGRNRLGGQLGRVRRGHLGRAGHAGDGLSDGADSGRNSNDRRNGSGVVSVTRAVRDGRSTAGDDRGHGGENGAGGDVAGDRSESGGLGS